MKITSETETIDYHGEELQVNGSGDCEHFEPEAIFWKGENVTWLIEKALSDGDSFWSNIGDQVAEQLIPEVDEDAIRERNLDI